MTLENPCLCGSGLDYQNCCGLYHSGAKIPQTAESLMRSRFTAYAMHNGDYLQATWDVSKRPEQIDFSKETAQWQRLEIVSVKKGGINDEKGMVEFKAYYVLDGEESVMNEISRFKKVAGRWFYLDGVVKSIGKVNQTSNQAAILNLKPCYYSGLTNVRKKSPSCLHFHSHLSHNHSQLPA